MGFENTSLVLRRCALTVASWVGSPHQDVNAQWIGGLRIGDPTW